MRVGQLNRMIQIQQSTVTADAEGFNTEVWSLLGLAWAHIVPTGGKESPMAAQVEEYITHQVTIRWRGDIAETRIRLLYAPGGTFSTRVFLVHNAINTEEANKELVCLCEEIVTTAAGVA